MTQKQPISTQARATGAARPAGEVRRLLVRMRRRVRAIDGLRGLGVALAISSVVFLLALGLDRYWILEIGTRTVLSAGVTGLATLLMAWKVLLPLVRPIPETRLARAIESRFPDLDECLLSAVELSGAPQRDRERCSTALLQALEETAARKALALRELPLVDARPASRRLLLGAAGIVLVGAVFLHDPESFVALARRFASPARELERPTTVILHTLPGTAAVARGDDVEVAITATRGAPEAVTLEHREPDAPWSTTTPKGKTRDGGTVWTHVFRRVTAPLEYRVAAGDFRSGIYRIDPEDAPRPLRFDITYTFPPYTRRPPQEHSSSTGNLAAVSGTEARLRITLQRDIERAFLVQGPSERPRRTPLEASGNTARLEELPIVRSVPYVVEFVTAGGVSSKERFRYRIEALADRAPGVELLEPAAREIPLEPSSLLPVRYRGNDDHGIAAVELIVERAAPSSEEPTVLVLFDLAADEIPPRHLERTWPLVASRLALRRGETGSLRLRARDLLGQESLSAPRYLRVMHAPHPPEGPGWLARLELLGDSLREIESEWRGLLEDSKEDAEGPLLEPSRLVRELESAIDRALGARVKIDACARSAGEIAVSIAVPSANRSALRALEFALEEAAAHDVSVFLAKAAAARDAMAQRVAVTGPLDSSLRTALAEARREHGSILSRIRVLGSSLEDIHRAERLEEAREALRLARVDLHRLEPWGETQPRAPGLERDDAPEGPDLAGRLGAAIGAVVEVAADLTRLGNRGAGATSIAWTARSLLRSVVGPLERARASLETANIGEAAGAGREALRAVHERLVELQVELDRGRDAAESARRALEAPRTPAERVRRLAALAGGTGEGRAADATILETRGVLRLLEFEMSCAGDFEVPDLESIRAFASAHDIVTREMRDTGPVVGAPAPSAESAGKSEKAHGALSRRVRALERLATWLDDAAPLLRLGRKVSEVEWIAAGEEELERSLRSLEPWNPRALGAAARTQHEILAAVAPFVRDITVDESLGSEAAARREIPRLVRTIEDARSAFRSVLSALELEPAAVDDARGAAARGARLLVDVSRALGQLRDAGYPAARRALGLLQRERGTVSERVAHLGEREAEHATQVREAAAPRPRRTAGELRLLRDSQLELIATATDLGASLREEASWGEPSAAVEGLSPETALRASLRLDEIAKGPMAAAWRLLATAVHARDPADPTLLAAARREDEAVSALRSLVEALAVLETRSIENRIGAELRALRGDPGAVAPSDPAELARRARELRDISAEAAHALSSTLPSSALGDELVEHLRAAAAHFASCVGLVAEDRPSEARREFLSGLARLDEALATAARLRGNAEDVLEPKQKDGPGGSEDSRDAEISEEEALVLREIQRLLALRELEQKVSKILEEITSREHPGTRSTEEALAVQEKLTEALEDQTFTREGLVALVSKLVVVDREGQQIESAERVLEEECRRLGAGDEAPPSTIVEAQEDLLRRARETIAKFTSAGSRLTIVLPRVFRSYRSASGRGAALLDSTESAAQALGEDRTAEAVEELAAARLGWGTFLAEVDATRRHALEAIAEGTSGSARWQGNGALIEALGASREVGRLLRSGQLDQARRAHRSVARGLRGASRSLAGAAGRIGSGGASVTVPVLGEPADGADDAWELLTRDTGELRTLLDAFREGDWFEMPFPESYRELVRIYRKALAVRR